MVARRRGLTVFQCIAQSDRGWAVLAPGQVAGRGLASWVGVGRLGWGAAGAWGGVLAAA
jgi:hypothetical protein